MYFVDTIDSSTNTTGANLGPGSGASDGLVLTDAANFRTTGHEIGHAGTLKDIYMSDAGTQVPSNLVNEAWAPRDWNSGPGPQYYERSLTQPDLLLRALMNGRPSQIKADRTNRQWSYNLIDAHKTVDIRAVIEWKFP